MSVLRRSIVLLALALAAIAPAGASAAHSVGTPEQIAWVRSAATRFVTAELAGNGAAACGILNAPLRATSHHRTCEQRQDARLKGMLKSRAARAHLHAQLHEIPKATVVVHGNVASLDLKTPLLHGPNRFLWTEMCWMLEG